jgi:hypothetical protein
MTAPNRRWLRTLFTITLFCGLAQLAVALVIIPLRAHFQLDIILTHDKLRDEAIREQALEVLQRAGANEGIVWLVPGMIISIASAAGCVATSEARWGDLRR